MHGVEHLPKMFSELGDNIMKTKIYDIGNYLVLEVNMYGEYEYYIRSASDYTDYFKFAVGGEDPFTEDELLEMEYYFDNIQAHEGF